MEYIQPQISPKIRQKTRFREIGKKNFFERFYVFCAFVFFFLRKKQYLCNQKQKRMRLLCNNKRNLICFIGMRKIYYLLLLITIFSISGLTLSSCGDDEDDSPKSIVGVWENGKYFVSLNKDKFLTAYINNKFIDNGTYEVASDNKSFSCFNTYFNHTTIYNIKSVSDTHLDLEISYINAFGENYKEDLRLTKSNKKPVSKDNGLVGKSCSFTTQSSGSATYDFTSYNTATISSANTDKSKYPQTLHYVYFDEKVYIQKFPTFQIEVLYKEGNEARYSDMEN